MIHEYLGHWWILTIRGALALLFGVMALFWPGLTLLVLAIVFGAYALVDGILAGVGAARAGKGRRAPLILMAIIGILAGIAALVWPGLTVLALTLVVGFWAIVIGVAEIVAAIRMRKEIQGEWLIIVAGALSLLFGILVVLWPGLGALTLALVIGVYAILAGITLIVLSLRVRKRQQSLPTGSQPAL